jgi:hypothetical protein
MYSPIVYMLVLIPGLKTTRAECLQVLPFFWKEGRHKLTTTCLSNMQCYLLPLLNKMVFQPLNMAYLLFIQASLVLWMLLMNFCYNKACQFLPSFYLMNFIFATMNNLLLCFQTSHAWGTQHNRWLPTTLTWGWKQIQFPKYLCSLVN